MATEFSLIKIGNVEIKGAPMGKVQSLYEKIICTISPRRRIEMARAEREVARIAAASDVETERIRMEGNVDLQLTLAERAAQCFLLEQRRQQENIEDVFQRAIPNLQETAAPEKIDEDWMSQFLQRARNVTNNDMQTLWARILAGEANRPGSFAKRTLSFLATLERDEGLRFSALLNLSIEAVGDLAPIITDFDSEIYTQRGLDFESVYHLQSIGLITVSETTAPLFITRSKKRGRLHYLGKSIVTEWKDSSGSIPMGLVMLSKIGKELSAVCKREAVPGFLDHVARFWKASGAVSVDVSDDQRNGAEPES